MSRLRGIGTLASGTVIAQLITVAATPFLTRLYSPEAFAVLALVVSTASMLAVFAHGRLTIAIAASDCEADARHIFATGRRLTWMVCLVAALALFALNRMGIAQDHTPSVIIAGCLLGGVLALLDLHAFYRNTAKAYHVSATASVLRAVATTVIQLVVAFAGALGLIVGAMGGALGALVYSQWALFRGGRATTVALPPPGLDWARQTLASHRNSLLFSAPQALVSALGHNLPPVLLAAAADPAVVGQYWLAYRLLVAPISILGGSYRQASIPVFRKNNPDALKILVRDTAALSLVVLAMGLGLSWLGADAFAFAFGAKWRTAGAIAGVLVIGYGADLAKVPAICLLQARRRDKLLLGVEAVVVAVKLGALAVALNRFGPMESLMVFTVTSAAGAGAFILMGAAFAKRHDRDA